MTQATNSAAQPSGNGSAGVSRPSQPLSQNPDQRRSDKPEKRNTILAVFIAIITPFIYLFPFTIPSERAPMIGNDFGILYYKYKAYLLDVMCHDWRIPLWSPSEAGGYPFLANPFSAALYPPNLLLSLIYKFNGGYSLYDHQLFAVAGVSILCLGLFFWLRSLGHRIRHALIAALIMGLSLASTELLRFPNAIHSAAWYPWILLGVTLVMLRGRYLLGGTIIAVASLHLLTAGYPYLIYYAQFLLVPYVLMLLFPRMRRILSIDRPQESTLKPWRSFGVVALSAAIPLVICLPYLLKIKEMLSQTVDRTGASFEFSTAVSWSLTDTLGSLIYPPAAIVEGWYYFGILPLILIFLYFFQLRFSRVRRHHLGFVILIASWFAVITYITMGSRSMLFRLMWDHWPAFATLREWPRLNILLVCILALIVARAYVSFERRMLSGTTTGASAKRVMAFEFLAVAAVILAIQAVLWKTETTSHYWHEFVVPEGWNINPLWYLAATVASVALGLAVILRRKSSLGWLAVCALGLCFLDTGGIGNRQWGVTPPPFKYLRRDFQITAMMPQALHTRRILSKETISLTPTFSVGYVPNWYFGSFIHFLTREGVVWTPGALTVKEERIASLSKILGAADGQRLGFVRRADHKELDSLLADASSIGSPVAIGVTRYNGDVLEVNVECQVEGFLCFIDNWDPNWRATVNGQRVEVIKLLGTFKAVKLAPGKSTVSFEYRPFG